MENKRSQRIVNYLRRIWGSPILKSVSRALQSARMSINRMGDIRQSNFVEALLAFSLNLIGFVGGGIVTTLSPMFVEHPWILALYPPILTVRGNLSGLYSGNLSTMLHLGLILPRLRRNTDYYLNLNRAIFFLTFIDTIIVGIASFIFGLMFKVSSFDQLPIYCVVPTISCIIANSISIPITLLVGIEAYKRGLDPDILVYPILSSVNDVLVSFSFAAVSILILADRWGFYLAGSLFLIIMVYCVSLFRFHRKNQFFSKTTREGVASIGLASIFGSLNGIFISGRAEQMSEAPGLVMLYPIIIDGLGDVGSAAGSMTTTSLALGYIRSLGDVLKRGLRELSQIEAAALLMHLVYGFIAYLTSSLIYGGGSLTFLTGVAVASNLLGFLSISLLAYLTAYLTYRRGLNPDNFVIPATASFSDFVATNSMLLSVSILRSLGL
ncbi:MAG: magnesium transporter [Candidatus Bathyarchaeia archaeon]|nr:magnesium transporter [Candidatus Bathyarchaeota archaeon]